MSKVYYPNRIDELSIAALTIKINHPCGKRGFCLLINFSGSGLPLYKHRSFSVEYSISFKRCCEWFRNHEIIYLLRNDIWYSFCILLLYFSPWCHLWVRLRVSSVHANWIHAWRDVFFNTKKPPKLKPYPITRGPTWSRHVFFRGSGAAIVIIGPNSTILRYLREGISMILWYFELICHILVYRN